MSINGLRYPNTMNINAGTLRLRGKTAGNVEIAPIICDSSVYVANLYCERALYSDAMPAGGNIVADLITGNVITSNGNLSGVDILASNDVTATGNISGSNLLASNDVTATGNVYGANVIVTDRLRSSVVTGTPPLVVASTTRVANLNAATCGTADIANALKSATTTVSVSAATAPSAGQVLTATNSTTATWQTPSGGSAAIYTASINLSAAQVLAMSVTPVQVIAAPGAGLAIVVLSATWSQTYVAPQYTAGTEPYLIFSSGTGASVGMATLTDIRGTANFVGVAPSATSVTNENQAVQITNPTTPFASGASTVKITVQYYILTV